MSRLTLFGIAALPAFLATLATGPGVSRAGARNTSDLAPPVAVAAGGATIDAPLNENGWPAYNNAFPWFGDFDGVGKPDLLVGQSTGGGRLRIYKNIGDKGRPRFRDPLWFDDLVPTGRIPDG